MIFIMLCQCCIHVVLIKSFPNEFTIICVTQSIQCFQTGACGSVDRATSTAKLLASILPMICTVNTQQVQLHNRWAAKISIVQSAINTALECRQAQTATNNVKNILQNHLEKITAEK